MCRLKDSRNSLERVMIMVERYEKITSSISGISRYIQKLEAEEMAKHGLKGSCAQYLVIMRRSDSRFTVSQLSESCMKDKAAVSRAVSELEANGLILREASGSNLYRATLALTDKGAQVADAVVLRVNNAVEQAGKGLSDSDRQVFYSSLELISANLKEMCKDTAI